MPRLLTPRSPSSGLLESRLNVRIGEVEGRTVFAISSHFQAILRRHSLNRTCSPFLTGQRYLLRWILSRHVVGVQLTEIPHLLLVVGYTLNNLGSGIVVTVGSGAS